MVSRIGRDLALGEFEHGMPLILKTEFSRQLLKNAFTIIENSYLGVDGSLVDAEYHGLPCRVLNGVVEYLCKAILPDVEHILREGTK